MRKDDSGEEIFHNKLHSTDIIYQTGTGRQTMIKLKWEWKINIYGLELEYSCF